MGRVLLDWSAARDGANHQGYNTLTAYAGGIDIRHSTLDGASNDGQRIGTNRWEMGLCWYSCVQDSSQPDRGSNSYPVERHSNLVSGEFLGKRPSGCERVPDTAGTRHIDRVSAGWWRFAGLSRRSRVERTVHAILVVIGAEAIVRPCQVVDIPEEYMVQILPSDCTDQPFDERMRAREQGQGVSGHAIFLSCGH